MQTNTATLNLLLLFVGLSLNAASVNAEESKAEKGKAVFAQCAGCHMVGPDAEHRFGPTLNGITGKPIASAEGYDYSEVFKTAASDGMAWSVETLDDFLKAPMEYLPGTKMAYPGLADESARANVISYLATFDAEVLIAESKVEESNVAEPAVKEKAPVILAKDVEVPTHGVLHLGRAAHVEEISAWDIDIRPDGTGLPEGGGLATDGAEIYDAQCASCHGVFGEGEGRWPILAGGFDTLTDDRPEKTIGSYWPYLSTVYDYVRRAMPFGNARSLSDDDVYALTAYLLYLNDLVDEDFELTSANFASIKLPNEDNFISDSRIEEPTFVSEGEPCMTDCIAGLAQVVQRARVLDVTPDTEDDEAGAGLD